MADKSLGQTYYEEVEALKAGGTSNADAVRAVASKHKKNENAIRGGIHQYKTRHLDGGGASTGRRRSRAAAASVDDLVAQAKTALEAALGLVDREVDDAKASLDAAQAHYDSVVASVEQRRADIAAKLGALS